MENKPMVEEELQAQWRELLEKALARRNALLVQLAEAEAISGFLTDIADALQDKSGESPTSGVGRRRDRGDFSTGDGME